MHRTLVIYLCYLVLQGYAVAQTTTDSSMQSPSVLHRTRQLFKKEQYGKNIIRYNPTPTLVLSDMRNAAIGYERKINRSQSVSANIGYFSMPDFLSREIGALQIKQNKGTGFIFSCDYRFYLTKLNTRPALNGIYIGPFYSLYFHRGSTRFTYDEGLLDNLIPGTYQADLNTQVQLHNIGFQLGYQFIFFKRISLDLILFGPAVTYYQFNTELESELNTEQLRAFYEQYYDAFFSKYPFFETLFNIGDIRKSEFSTGFLANYRYMFQIGYHF